MSVSYGVSPSYSARSVSTALNGIPTTSLYYAIDANNLNSYSGGATVADLTGTSVTSTFTNGAYWEAGDYTNNYISSFVFDGTNDIIVLNRAGNTSSPILLTCPWTCYFWVKTASDGAFFSHYSGGPVNNGMYINGGKLAYAYYDGQWNYVYSTGATVTTNAWTLITYTCPASTTGSMKMYVNGVLDYTFSPRISWGSYNMGGFGSLWGFQYLNGRMSQILVYTAEHSQADITSMYNITKKKFS
jgi:hypothetical protein